MRDKIYQILKITNDCVFCTDYPLYEICDNYTEDICSFLEKLDDKLIEENE